MHNLTAHPVIQKLVTKAPAYAIVCLFVISVTSCGFYKNALIWEKGTINQSEFYSEIPFEYRAGLPIISVEVNGVSASFLFDTGAPNVISEDLANRLNAKQRKFGHVRDSGGNSKAGSQMMVDSIKIGDVVFSQTGALVMNLGSSFVFNCIDFDGIIGANLMRKAKWKIDYEYQKIIFSNDIKKLGSIEKGYIIPFKVKNSFTPVIEINLNDEIVSNVTFDTGSNGNLSISQSKFAAIASHEKNISQTISAGASNYGVYGKAKNDSTIYARISSTKMGTLVLDSNVVEFKRHSNILGTKFFKNYKVIMDWESRNMTLLPYYEYNRRNLVDYGFKLDVREGKLYIGSLHQDSITILSGIMVGDQILAVDHNDFSNLSEKEACDIINKSRKIALAPISEFVLKRGIDTLFVQLPKRPLLPMISGY